MPRKAAQRGSAAPGSGSKSDEEILQERRRVEAVKTADFVLLLLSWGLWVLAAFWFFNFADQAPPTLLSTSDIVVSLLVCGQLCCSLARSSKNGAWSSWRKPWYLAWALVLVVICILFAQKAERAAAVACALGAVAVGMACPASCTPDPKSSTAVLGHLLLRLDGLVVLALCVASVLQADMSQPLGRLATALAVLPLAMTSLALLCGSSQAEVQVAVPMAMLQLAGSSLCNLLFGGSGVALAALAAGLVTHGALYLPFPVQDPDSNPFYSTLRKSFDNFAKVMSSPVSGFNDGAE
eukprot:TRINITY_DN108566_c0_g1_i1.p1 TRINITY_DN108566_c0_g1~~TRINITY_DN108566_c0_g1_i1.p1  ORF type:complete len:295 (+),score=73.07 TRINITY_DN108566_c0_g1_i1:74-958(+)